MDFYRDFNLTLSAGEIRQISAYGSFLTILENNTVTDLVVSIDGNAGQAIPSGISIELPADKNYSGFYIQNISGGAMTVRFAISSGKIMDARFKTSGMLNTNVINIPHVIVDTAPTTPVTNSDITSIKSNTRLTNGDTGTLVGGYGNATNAVTTIYTVTAGKTLYLANGNFSGYGSSGNGQVIITNAADIQQMVLANIVIGGNGIASPLGILYPVKVPATWKIKVTSSSTIAVIYACINGWEE